MNAKITTMQFSPLRTLNWTRYPSSTQIAYSACKDALSLGQSSVEVWVRIERTIEALVGRCSELREERGVVSEGAVEPIEESSAIIRGPVINIVRAPIDESV